MTVQVKELPKSQDDTMATRLLAARERMRLSRREVSELTGIPQRSVEKFENGSSEPSASRLIALSDLYEMSVNEILGIDEAPGTLDDDPTDVPAKPRNVTLQSTSDEPAALLLDELDELREAGFEGSPRAALALTDDLLRELRHLEANELVELAEERGLFKTDYPSSAQIFDLFVEDPETAQRYCGMVEERIADTALLGVDLHAIERNALARLADQLAENHEGIERPVFFGWGEHTDFVPLIQPALRMLAVSGNLPDFGNRKEFPRRR